MPAPGQHRRWASRFSPSEVRRLVIAFQDSDYRTCKHFYRKQVCRHGRAEFPPLVSYPRLLERLPGVLVPGAAYLETRLERTRGIAFIDSLPLPVCHNRRLYNHPVFADFAPRGKSSLGWFYGFKLPFVMNDEGDLLAWRLTPSNVDDRTPVPDLAEGLGGKLFGDRGYICQDLFEPLWETRCPTHHEAQTQDEKQADAALGQTAMAQASVDGKCRRAVKTGLPDRTHASSQCPQRLCPCLRRSDSVYQARTQTFAPPQPRRTSLACWSFLTLIPN